LGVVVFIAISLSIFNHPVWGEAGDRWCRLGRYDFDDQTRMKVALNDRFDSPVWRAAQGDKIYVRIQADRIKKARLARLRLLDQAGRLYSKAVLKPVKTEGQSFYQAQVVLDKEFDWLVVEALIQPAGRRSRQPFFFQSLVVADQLETQLDRSDWCWAKQDYRRVDLIQPVDLPATARLTAWLNDARRGKTKLKVAQSVFAGEVDKLTAVELELKDLTLADGWYDLTLTAKDKKSKPVLLLVLPVYLTNQGLEFSLEQPQPGETITDTVTVSGRLESSLPVEVIGWYTDQQAQPANWIKIR